MMIQTKVVYCGWWIVKALFFVIGSFVFSLIFWKTKQWLDSKSSPKKKK